MKRLTSSTAIAAVMALCGFIGSAHAVTYSENPWTAGQPNAPLYFTVVPDASTPVFVLSTTGSVSGNQRSPYENNTNGFANAAYSVLAPGGASQTAATASATYNINNTIFALLWGSPDSYNEVQFYSAAGGAGGGGSLMATYTGANLACFIGNTCNQLTWDVVTFSSDTPFGSVVLTDNSNGSTTVATPAFEYGLRVGTNQGETPLPAAFWLFGTVIAGTAGASRMRRRRRQLQLA
jgi:hypothetical protein